MSTIPLGPVYCNRGCLSRTDPEMQRLAALGSGPTAAAAVILAEGFPPGVSDGHACANPIAVGLDALQFQLDKMIGVSVIFKEVMVSYRSFHRHFRRRYAVLDDQVEKTIVVIIPPGRKFVGRGL